MLLPCQSGSAIRLLTIPFNEAELPLQRILHGLTHEALLILTIAEMQAVDGVRNEPHQSAYTRSRRCF